jgi:hypothetical protein
MSDYTLKALLLLTIAVVMVSCAYPIPRSLKNNFTFNYTPNKKGLDSLVNINGYFSQNNITSYSNYVFFDDGVVLVGATGLREDKNGREIFESPDNLPSFFAKLLMDTTHQMYLTGRWGTYVTSNDTIKTQFIAPSISLNAGGPEGFEYHFKVMDRETIKLVFIKRLHHLSYNDRRRYPQAGLLNLIKDVKPATFVKCDTIPSSKCWLMMKKWFWANGTDYHNYVNKNVTDRKGH